MARHVMRPDALGHRDIGPDAAHAVPGPTSTIGGQRARDNALRSRADIDRQKVQPAGRSASSGTVPEIVFSRVPLRAPSRGRARNRPCV